MNVSKSFVKFIFITAGLLLPGLALSESGSNLITAVDPTVAPQTSVSPALASPASDALMPMLLALLFIMLVIFVIAWLAKKFNLTPNNGMHFKLVSSMSLGGRERIVIIEVQGQQHAIGVTGQSVNHLFQLEKNIESVPLALGNQALVGKINKLFGYTPPADQSKPN